MTKKKTFKVDKTWIIDKVIELSIFVLGFLIALWIDGVREENDVKQLKQHYLSIVEFDLEQDHVLYNSAYQHDSIRADGCDYILTWLLKRQSSTFHSFGLIKNSVDGHIGPGFEFDKGIGFNKGDTLQIIAEKGDWFMSNSGDWVNKHFVKSLNNDFNWFSSEINDSVISKINDYAYFVDETKSVFQQTAGYEGLISQNTSSFLNTTEIETKLSNYYSKGSYLNWLENYYRDNHYVQYNTLRYTFGQTDFFRFLILINSEENNQLIRHLTIASIHARKEMKYYLDQIERNNNLLDLISKIDL